MFLPQLTLKQNIIAENMIERNCENLKSRNPKFKIDEKLKFKVLQTLIEKDTKYERNYINIKIKDIKYSPTLEDNVYIVIILDTVGKIEDYIAEKDLVKNII